MDAMPALRRRDGIAFVAWRQAVGSVSSLRDDLGLGHDRRAGAAELALRRVGLSAERLTKIVRKAIVDYYAETGGSLGGDRLDDAVSFVRERLLGELGVYDRSLAGGVSVETFTYRRARFRVVDWLRTKGEGLEFGDARSGSQGKVGLTDDGVLEVARSGDDGGVDVAVERLAVGLSDRDRWTLRHVATAAAEGLTLEEVIEGLILDLADALRPQLPDDLRRQLADGNPASKRFAEWFGVAA